MDNRVCTICDGGPGNSCACSCGFERWDANSAPLPLPDTNPKTAYGVQKTPVHLVPPPALLALAEVMGLGAKKYGPYNWREHAVSASVYQAAAMRHLLAWWSGESTDPESGQSHLAHAMACCAIVLDAEAVGKLNDDRPGGGK
jgi:hypothetical protein